MKTTMNLYVIQLANRSAFFCYDGIVNHPHREPMFTKCLNRAVVISDDANGKTFFSDIRRRSRGAVSLKQVVKRDGWVRFA